MKTLAKISIAACGLAILGAPAWHTLHSREPVYQGQRLSQWLDKYNQVGALDKTEPISAAIRSMGTNSLPFLLAHIEADSPLRQRLCLLAGKLRLLRLPFYGASPYRATSLMALQALGAEAAPLCPELLPTAENPRTSYWGMMSLLAVGPKAIPTLERLCQSTNVKTRTQAVLMLATMQTMPSPWLWVWTKDPVSARPLLGFASMATDDVVRKMVKMLSHSDAAVRRASAEAIGRYTSPYTGVASSAVPSLVAALKDGDARVRQSAGETLKIIAPQTAAEAAVK